MRDDIPLIATLRRACLPPRDDRGESLQRLLDFHTVRSIRELLEGGQLAPKDWDDCVDLIDVERSTLTVYYTEMQIGDLQDDWEELFAWRRLRSMFCVAAALSRTDDAAIMSQSKCALRTFGISVEGNGQSSVDGSAFDTMSSLFASAAGDSNTGFIYEIATYLAGRERAPENSIRLPVCVIGPQRSPIPTWLRLDVLQNGCGRIFPDPKEHFQTLFSLDYIESLNTVARATQALLKDFDGAGQFDYRFSIDLPNDCVISGSSMSGAFAAALLVHSQMQRNRPNSLVVLADCSDGGVLNPVDGIREKIAGIQELLQTRYRGRAVIVLPPGKESRSIAETCLRSKYGLRDEIDLSGRWHGGTRVSWDLKCFSDLSALRTFLREAQSEPENRIRIEPVSNSALPQSQVAKFLDVLNAPDSPAFEAEPRMLPQARLPVEREFQFPRKEFIDWRRRILASSHPVRLLIHGPGGTGKTHLLLMLAHQVIEQRNIDADHFPGLYVDLLGYSGSPLSQEECLRKLLGTLLGSYHYRLPARLDDLHDLYHQQLEDKSLTVYLDNVFNFDQIEHVMPPGHCGCVISARENFQLDRFDIIKVDLMDGQEATEFALHAIQFAMIKDLRDADTLYLSKVDLIQISQKIARASKGHALRLSAMAGGFCDECGYRADWDALLIELEMNTDSKIVDIFQAMYEQLGEHKDAARRLSMFPRDFDPRASDYLLGSNSGRSLSALSRRNVLTPIVSSENSSGQREIRYLMHDEFRSFLKKKVIALEEGDQCLELLAKYFSDLNQLPVPPEHRIVDDGREFVFNQESTTIYAIRDWLCDQQVSHQRRKIALEFAKSWHSALTQKSEEAEENARFLTSAVDWASKANGSSQLHFDLLISIAELQKRNGNRKAAEPLIESALEVARQELGLDQVSQALFELVFLVVDWDAEKATRFAYERTILEAKQKMPDSIALAMGLIGMVADESHGRPLDGLKYYRTALRFGEEYACYGKSVFTSANRIGSIARSVGYHAISERCFRQAFLSYFCQNNPEWHAQSLEDWLDAYRLSGSSLTDVDIDHYVDSVVESLIERDEKSKVLKILISAFGLHFQSGNASEGWRFLEFARNIVKGDPSLSQRLRESTRRLLRSLSEYSEFKRLISELVEWHKTDANALVVREPETQVTEKCGDGISHEAVLGELADLYDEAGLRFERESDFELAHGYYWKSLRAAERANDTPLIRVAWQRLIRANLRRNDYEVASRSAKTVIKHLEKDTSLSDEDRDQFVITGRAFEGKLLRLAQRHEEAWQSFEAAYIAPTATGSDELLGLVLSCICDLDGIEDPAVREKEFKAVSEFLSKNSQRNTLLRLHAIRLVNAVRTYSPDILEKLAEEFVTVAAEVASQDEPTDSLAIAPYALLALSDGSLALRILSELQSAVGEAAGQSFAFSMRLTRVMILQHTGRTREALECIRGLSEINSILTDEQKCEVQIQLAHLLRLHCEFSTCKEIYEKLREFTARNQLETFVVIAEANLAILAMTQGQYTEAHELVIRCRKKCIDNRIRAYLLAVESELFLESGDADQAIQLASDSLSLAEDAGDDECLISSLLHVVACRRARVNQHPDTQTEEYRAIDSEMSRSVESARHIQDIHLILDVLEAQVECDIVQGRLESAEESFRQFIETSQGTDSKLIACRAGVLSGKISVAKGDFDQALNILNVTREQCLTVQAVHLENEVVRLLLELSQQHEVDSSFLSSLRARRDELHYDFETVDEDLLHEIESKLNAGEASHGMISRAVGVARSVMQSCASYFRRVRQTRFATPSPVTISEVSIGDVFHEMVKHFDTSCADKMIGTYQFDISGEGGGIWTFAIDEGKCQLVVGGVPDPSVEIALPVETWLAIREGKLNSQQAFMDGELKIRGDMNLAMKLQQLFPIA